MKNIILSESQSKKLAEMLLNEEEKQVQSMPVDKKMNKPFYINPDKVLIVKKYLDKGFSAQDFEDVGPDGYPRIRKIISMNAVNGQPLKLMYTEQLLDLLIDKFQNMFSDKNERFMFMKQVLNDWLGGKIGVHGTLSVNMLKEGTINEVSSEAIAAEGENVDLNPTEKQKEAGNYRMGHISVKGMGITIENRKGSFRSGTDNRGREWRTELKNHYGYFRNTRGNGKDGDAVDVFIGPSPEDFSNVYVVDQKVDGEFDESKVMLGFHSKAEAKAAYLSNYDENWNGFWKITGVSISTFKRWLYRDRKQRKPFADYVAIKKDKITEDVMIAEVNDIETAQKLMSRMTAKGIATKLDENVVYMCYDGNGYSQAKADLQESIARKTILEYSKEYPDEEVKEIGDVMEDINRIRR